jgi:hypothetical protein
VAAGSIDGADGCWLSAPRVATVRTGEPRPVAADGAPPGGGLGYCSILVLDLRWMSTFSSGRARVLDPGQRPAGVRAGAARSC